jgi:hypothetical protein
MIFPYVPTKISIYLYGIFQQDPFDYQRVLQIQTLCLFNVAIKKNTVINR